MLHSTQESCLTFEGDLYIVQLVKKSSCMDGNWKKLWGDVVTAGDFK